MKKFFIRIWFKLQLSREKLICVNDNHRGVGKTTMLVDMASKKGYAIVVGSQMTADTIKRLNPSVQVLRLAENFTHEVKGKNGDFSVLIDESVSEEMVDWLIKEGIVWVRGGFLQNYGK